MIVTTIASLLFVISISQLMADNCPNPQDTPQCVCYERTELREGIDMSCYIYNLNELDGMSQSSYSRHLNALTIHLKNITTLPPFALRFKNIISLNVIGENVTSIHSNAFVGLQDSLTALYFSRTHLRKIPLAAISHLHKISFLMMTECKLTTLNESLVNTSLQTLYFTDNEISSISPGILPPNLFILDLSNNRLPSLNGTLRGNLSVLYMLRISNNLISNLSGELHGTPNLRNLYAKANDIESIENDPFSSVSKLELLHLSRNRIRKVVTGLRGLFRLKELDLSHNGLRELDITALSDLVAIENLNLSHNNITYLDVGLFDCLVLLRTLDISYNSLSEIDFLVSPEALLGQERNVPFSLDISKCNFMDNSSLIALTMTESGVSCSNATYQIIHYFRRRQAFIFGDPC